MFRELEQRILVGEFCAVFVLYIPAPTPYNLTLAPNPILSFILTLACDPKPLLKHCVCVWSLSLQLRSHV